MNSKQLVRHKLSANENPFGASPRVRDMMHEFQEIHLYPDASATSLKAALGCTFSVDPRYILCGCGSEDLLHSSIMALVEGGDEVVIPRHGFCVYDIAIKNAKAIPVYVDYRIDMRLDVDDFLSKITHKTALVCIDNPGNPIGTYICKSDIERLLANIPSSVVVILDAAYAEYMMEYDDYTDGMGYIQDYQNVIVTRTFSKAYGLAGFRIGWLYASAPLIGRLMKQRLLYKTTAISQAAAIAALSDMEFVTKTVQHNTRFRDVLHKFLKQNGFFGWHTFANFVICDCKAHDRAIAMVEHLKDHGVDVMSLQSYGLSHLIRVSVGSAEAVSCFMQVVSDAKHMK